MSPDEYKRIKEAEKAHLRKLKELKAAVRQLERKRKVSQTMADMTTSAADQLDASDELVEKLALETVRQEARLELALERAEEREREEAARQRLQAFEADQQRARAKDLVRRLKTQLGSPDEAAPETAAPAASSEQAPDADARDKTTSSDPDPLPEKTIGRMR